MICLHDRTMFFNYSFIKSFNRPKHSANSFLLFLKASEANLSTKLKQIDYKLYSPNVCQLWNSNRILLSGGINLILISVKCGETDISNDHFNFMISLHKRRFKCIRIEWRTFLHLALNRTDLKMVVRLVISAALILIRRWPDNGTALMLFNFRDRWFPFVKSWSRCQMKASLERIWCSFIDVIALSWRIKNQICIVYCTD